MTPRWFTLPKLRLSHQMIGFFVVVVFIPLLLLSFSIYNINQKALKKQVAQFTADSAEATYRELALELQWQVKEATLASALWNDSLQVAGNTSPTTQGAISFYDRFPDYLAVGLYDAYGHLISSSFQHQAHEGSLTFSPQLTPINANTPLLLPPGQTFNSPLKPSKGSPLQPALALSPLDISALYPNEQPQLALEIATLPDASSLQSHPRYVLISQQPIYQGNPAYPQVFIVQFIQQFDFLEDLLNQKQGVFGQGLVLTNQQGVILAGPKSWIHRSLGRHDVEILNAMKDLKTTDDGGYPLHYTINNYQSETGQAPNHIEKIIYRLPALNANLVMEAPYEINKRFIVRARTQSIGLLILCIIVIVALGFFYNKGITRNFRQLIKGIKAVAEGHYSRRIRLITKSWTPHEIVVLTGEFNRMATKISKAWLDIQQLNQELVHKNEIEEFIAKATQRIHSSLELEQVCQTAAQQFCKLPPILGCQLWLADAQQALVPQAQVFCSQPTTNASAQSLQQVLQHLQATLPQKLSPSLKFVFKRQMYSTFNHTQLEWIPKGLKLSIYPILYQAQAIGVIAFWLHDTTKESRYKNMIPIGPAEELVPSVTLGADMATTREDQLVIELLINQVGVAVHQARQWKQLQQANQQLAKLDDMKSNLIDTVSHELRTPLTSIKGYTSRLIRYDSNLEPDTRIKSLKVVKKQADRLERLVNDLLVIPDLEKEGGLRVFPDEVQLNPLVQHTVILLDDRAQRPIEVDMPETPLQVLADPDRLEQVLLNLLDNALKYGLADRPIQLSVNPTPDSEEIVIRVFNPCEEPIPDDALGQLFDKFKRLDERLTRTTRGTGLGLYIAKGLIEAMGGRIWLDNTGGFAVYVALPMVQPPTGDLKPASGLAQDPLAEHSAPL